MIRKNHINNSLSQKQRGNICMRSLKRKHWQLEIKMGQNEEVKNQLFSKEQNGMLLPVLT